jgi:hypothetical protein
MWKIGVEVSLYGSGKSPLMESKRHEATKEQGLGWTGKIEFLKVILQ